METEQKRLSSEEREEIILKSMGMKDELIGVCSQLQTGLVLASILTVVIKAEKLPIPFNRDQLIESSQKAKELLDLIKKGMSSKD